MGSWRDVRAEGGGALLDLGTHEIDLARYLFDSEVEFVTAKIESRRADHDRAELVLELENDVFIKITVGLGDAPNDAAFLRAVDIPILMASPRVDQLRALVPGGRVTALEGPAGWSAAVLAVLDEGR